MCRFLGFSRAYSHRAFRGVRGALSSFCSASSGGLLALLIAVFTLSSLVDPFKYFDYLQPASAHARETSDVSPTRGFLPRYSIKVTESFPHDFEAFTQGLIYLDGFIYESTGLGGKSGIRKVELQTGKVIHKFDLPPQFFGEGLTGWKNFLIQLTWHSGTGFVYDRQSLKVLRKFNYSGEGWGITHDDENLIMSNGSNKLIFLNPETFEQERVVEVFAAGRPVRLLNELEYVKGEILANIWQKDVVARISPSTGKVTGWIDMSELRDRMPAGIRAEVLNGIAYDSEKDRLFVTGKYWPKLFQVEIVDAERH